ncbi:MAG: sigma-70 family RNA polymerase sigma factor [Caulobacteraceae bacterium]|nr:sigma-70 family RNA polymerase sigma factor [Caulobacteraceae bacterium]
MTDAIKRKAAVPTDVEALAIRYRRPLLRYFKRRVGGDAEAEDLAQEVFVRILRQPQPTIENKDGYIFTVAANLLRDRARQARSRPEQVELASEVFDPALVEDFTPDRVLVGRERLWEVLAHLNELEPRTRDIILMFRLDRMRQRDIAKTLGISVSAVEKHVARALAHLVERLELRRDVGADDGS